MSLTVTWQTSLENLQEPGRRLLPILAWLAPDPIPESLLEREAGRSRRILKVRMGMKRTHAAADIRRERRVAKADDDFGGRPRRGADVSKAVMARSSRSRSALVRDDV